MSKEENKVSDNDFIDASISVDYNNQLELHNTEQGKIPKIGQVVKFSSDEKENSKNKLNKKADSKYIGKSINNFRK